MTEPNEQTAKILAELNDVERMRPPEELATYEQVLMQLTELLNAPDELTPGAR